MQLSGMLIARTEVLPSEGPGGHNESLAARCRSLDGQHECMGEVAHVDPRVAAEGQNE